MEDPDGFVAGPALNREFDDDPDGFIAGAALSAPVVGVGRRGVRVGRPRPPNDVGGFSGVGVLLELCRSLFFRERLEVISGLFENFGAAREQGVVTEGRERGSRDGKHQRTWPGTEAISASRVTFLAGSRGPGGAKSDRKNTREISDSLVAVVLDFHVSPITDFAWVFLYFDARRLYAEVALRALVHIIRIAMRRRA